MHVIVKLAEHLFHVLLPGGEVAALMHLDEQRGLQIVGYLAEILVLVCLVGAEGEVDYCVDVLVDDGVVEVFDHSRHAEVAVVGRRYVASYGVGRAEQAARGALRQHDVAFLHEACGTVAVEKGEVEHGEERRVSLHHVNVDKGVVILQLHLFCREAARKLHFGKPVAQVSQGDVVAVGRLVAVACLQTDVVYAVGLAVLAVDAVLLPCI